MQTPVFSALETLSDGETPATLVRALAASTAARTAAPATRTRSFVMCRTSAQLDVVGETPAPARAQLEEDEARAEHERQAEQADRSRGDDGAVRDERRARAATPLGRRSLEIVDV